jgi:hypothetical protein
MYGWLWRHMPGNVTVKLAITAVLLLATLWLLFEHVFPWLDPRLPFNQVTPEGTNP